MNVSSLIFSAIVCVFSYRLSSDDELTLEGLRFIQGDFIDVAIVKVDARSSNARENNHH